MEKAWSEGLVTVFPLSLPRCCQRAHGISVVRPVAGNEFVALRLAVLLVVLPGNLEGGFICFGTAVGKEDHVVVAKPFV